MKGAKNCQYVDNNYKCINDLMWPARQACLHKPSSRERPTSHVWHSLSMLTDPAGQRPTLLAAGLAARQR